ncbi:MAG: hypothetical protein H6581_18020 [Bacteroidia bacterium]|nr:hypothetical protein [Bacteroidia bacterium]
MKSPLQAGYLEYARLFQHPDLTIGDYRDPMLTFLHQLNEFLGLSSDNPLFTQDLKTLRGKALSTYWAGHCLVDHSRTWKFCQGIIAAVKDKLTEKKKPIKLLYAGCGPFATLALPLTQVFTPDQLQITLLEINPESLSILQKVIQEIEIEAFFPQIVNCDACLWVADQKYDVVVTETMQAALRQEPQVSISLHLMQQFPDDTVLIPAEISITALLERRAQPTLERPLFSLSATGLEAHSGEFVQGEHLIYRDEFDLPPETDLQDVSLDTRIHIYKTWALGHKESGLTMPHYLQRNCREVSHLAFTYTLDENPSWQLQIS